MIILVVALILSMIITLFNLKNTILKPIFNLKKSIDNIKNNDSTETTRIEIHSKDEIGDVVESFNQYLDSSGRISRILQI